MQRIWGKWHEGLSEAPNSLPSNSFVKTPQLISYEQDGSNFGEQMLAEAEILEILKRRPHRNICTYYGCIRNGGYVTGLCLKRYTSTLFGAVHSGTLVNIPAVLADVREGIDFLHSLGLVHNDLNPHNIMLDNNGVGVIIDFDSCKRIGQPMGIKGGTKGWSKEPAPEIAVVENDDYALGLIVKFLEGRFEAEEGA